MRMKRKREEDKDGDRADENKEFESFYNSP
jgi:hypothetical protein